MLYNARIDEEKQRFVIERAREIIAFLPMPTQKSPNPGRDALLNLPGNQEAWNKIYDLVEDANEPEDVVF